ncbi:hypothetical protein TYRP_022177 [Tyrophagus putrescentiae]|nr:hypothetical protein TYRP_022177 [Tyrophagus putrescentiae]
MALFALYLDYALTLNLDDFLIRALQEIMVENGRDFRLLNDGVNRVHWPKVTDVADLWTLVASYRALVRGIWTCFSLKFYQNKLEYFPALSGKLRAQMVVFTAIIEGVIVFLNTVAFFAVIFILGAATAEKWTRFPHLSLTIADLLLIGYFAWSAIWQCFFALHLLTLITFLSSGHMTELNDSLAVALKQSHLVMFKYRFLAYFQREYHLLLGVARYTNAAIVSQLMFGTLLSNITLNVVMIGNLLFRKSLHISEKGVMLTVVTLQTVLALLAVFGLTFWSSTFFQCSDRLLFKAQLILASKEGDPLYRRSVMTMAKLKLAGFFEQVLTTDEFRFTLGPFGKISKAYFYNFALLYSGIVMYVAKMVSRGRL